MDSWWINGQRSRQIDATDRGLAYADGLFETIAIRAGQLRFMELHLERLLSGCRRLRIGAVEGIPARIAAALHASGVSHGVLKVLVTRGPGPRGYALPLQAVTTVACGIEETLPRTSESVAVRWCETMVSANPALAGIKSLARLEQVLARAEWTAPGTAEGLMTSTEGKLIGGTASNVFLVIDGRLLTPAVHRAGIAGVMRRVVLAAASRFGIEAVEADIDPAAVQAASELFLTNALTGIRPVRQLGATTWDTGPVTRSLQQALVAEGVGECAGPC